MLTTKRKPATVGEFLIEKFMQPMGLTQAVLARGTGRSVLRRAPINSSRLMSGGARPPHMTAGPLSSP